QPRADGERRRLGRADRRRRQARARGAVRDPRRAREACRLVGVLYRRGSDRRNRNARQPAIQTRLQSRSDALAALCRRPARGAAGPVRRTRRVQRALGRARGMRSRAAHRGTRRHVALRPCRRIALSPLRPVGPVAPRRHGDLRRSAETGAGASRPRRRQGDGGPLVSIVIPTKNQLALLKRCVETVLRVTTYQNYEILIVDNGSTSQDAIDYLQLIEDKAGEIGGRIRVLRYPGPFNFSAMNNRAMKDARGDYICLLNNDTAPLDPEWLSEMMQHARRPEVGA